MNADEETHRILARIETELGQIKSSVSNLQSDMSKISGGLAVVLSRSDDNKTEIGVIKAELDANKKKRINYSNKFSNLSNISGESLQKTKLALSQWRTQHPLRKM